MIKGFYSSCRCGDYVEIKRTIRVGVLAWYENGRPEDRIRERTYYHCKNCGRHKPE